MLFDDELLIVLINHFLRVFSQTDNWQFDDKFSLGLVELSRALFLVALVLQVQIKIVLVWVFKYDRRLIDVKVCSLD